MYGKIQEGAFQAFAFRALPCKTVVDGGIDAGFAHARVWRVGEHIDRVGAVAGGQQMEIRFAFEPALLPGPAAVAALDQAERGDETRSRRRGAAAVKKLLGR